MDIEEKLHAFAKLGNYLRAVWAEQLPENLTAAQRKFGELAQHPETKNPWFVTRHVNYALKAISDNLRPEFLQEWIEPYKSGLEQNEPLKTIAVVMAGNIPMVGFHDFVSVLVSGNRFLGKLSSQDRYLLPALSDVLVELEPKFKERIFFTEDVLKDFDAVIATGSNNTSRYFDYYFGKYPNLIRENRNGVAVLTGDESFAELNALGKDILLYFGLGCRNVSKLYVPKGFAIDMLFEPLQEYDYVADNHKYRNNYDYFKTIYMVNRENFQDNGFILFRAMDQISTPVSVVHYERYEKVEQVKAQLLDKKDNIQCVVGRNGIIQDEIAFGHSQDPQLWDYADGRDTLRFLLNL
ncbi:MAG: acyl-CoA reductase [Bacteroidales bacterium]|nr:acyl-CoA reductase [Bacteroidales bacterium]MCF8344373.1 acyl-CoA reductase [Bacteroidales bacterium]MCF8352504.1 acyl-CoA reductase [Bacteroidales bacterium]MCF8377201.1 acyl-CoA reductase [Bacteroidales bacterium]MCF8401072.1 acyl-CoA reductase [Bacteroidales bacterium]